MQKNLCFYYVKYKIEYLYLIKLIVIKNRKGNMIVIKKRKKVIKKQGICS